MGDVGVSGDVDAVEETDLRRLYRSAMGDLASRPPALIRFCRRSLSRDGWRSLVLGLNVLATDEPIASTAANRPRFCSTKAWALRLRGNAGKLAGSSAPFCSSISAMGNGTVFSAVLGPAVIEAGDGEAGSAAASAR